MLQRNDDPRPLDERPVASDVIASNDDAASQDNAFPDNATIDVASPWLSGDTQAFLVSLLFHTVLVLALAVVPTVVVRQELVTLRDAGGRGRGVRADRSSRLFGGAGGARGAGSGAGAAMALATAPVLADLSVIPAPTFDRPVIDATYALGRQIEQAMGVVRSREAIKGMTGVGTTGTDGAVDRITYEILRSMEERPTLVVWFFDQSGSLRRRREEIRDRFDRIYNELGIVERSRRERGEAKSDDEPLLTSVFAFGQQVQLLTPQPTADLAEIRGAIDGMVLDDSGVERVFTAIYKGVEKYKGYRSGHSGRGPERNVMFIAVTDERGDDMVGLEATIKECRKYAIPVYVIGVPAPFGRDVTYVKYVDPDPRFDQTPQWAEVDQGPESIRPERVRLGYRDNYQDEPVIDSGFGPYALSRLCYETGGIYFTVHPNRRLDQRVRRGEIEPFASRIEYFFDPEIMDKYRPDYVSVEEYVRRAEQSPLRRILIEAATMSRSDTLSDPTLRFVKRDEASLANLLTQAQQQAARVQPALDALAEFLRRGESHRDAESSPRWIAGFDLALGTALAHRARSEAYNAMLAKAKRGMKFESDESNTWVLRPDREISVGSRLEKDAEQARKLLTEVAERHRGTPWGLLAERELAQPIGWRWTEEVTPVEEPARGNRPNAGTPRPPRDDQARNLPPPPPKRPIPKL